MNMIIGKRQILLGLLAVTLGVAVYINWNFTKDSATDDEQLPVTQLVENGENYGEAQFVAKNESDLPRGTASVDMVNEIIDNNSGNSATANTNANANASVDSNYFAQAKFNRENARDNATQTLQNVFKDSADSEEKAVAVQKAEALAKAIDIESNIENLIIAKGFEDCIAFIDEEKASVVVKSDGLIDSDVAKIKEIIVSQSGIAPQNISIVEVA